MTGSPFHFEDPDRELDGVPHVVVAMTIGVAALFAMAVVGMVLVTSWTGRIFALALFAFAVFVASRIGRRSARDRARAHPSR